MKGWFEIDRVSGNFHFLVMGIVMLLHNFSIKEDGYRKF